MSRLARFRERRRPPRTPERVVWAWAAIAFASLVTPLGLAHSPPAGTPTLGQVLAAIDPGDDPGVAHFAREALRPPPSWPDTVRWSAQTSAGVDASGAGSGSVSARVALPLDPEAALADRTERHRVSARLAELQGGELARGYVYGVLELVCRWGYLAAVEPLLRDVAELDADEPERWRAKAEGARWERDALAAQIEAHAPAAARLLRTTFRGFSCRFAPIRLRPLADELESHPLAERTFLEQRRDALQDAFVGTLGVPELSLDGSLRYGGGGGWDADVRVSLHFPIRLPGATAFVDIDADPSAARLTFRVDGSAAPPAESSLASIDRTWARERAALQLRLAGTLANRAALRAEAGAYAHDPRLRGSVGTGACFGICPVGAVASRDPGDLIAQLDHLALAWELGRVELELRRLLAVPPGDLLPRNAAG